MQADASYGLWLLVLLNTALFAIFAASFLHPRPARDWKAMYTFNQYRGTEEATESYGHQIEAELSNFDFTLFTTKFENAPNPPYPSQSSAASRCGSVHNPPNASKERDTANTTGHASDCMNWFPDGLGTTSSISCLNWGCNNNGDNDNPSLNWIRWWMQNIPGKGNTVMYQGSPLSNWWDIHATSTPPGFATPTATTR
jgi:hypothetical protein